MKHIQNFIMKNGIGYGLKGPLAMDLKDLKDLKRNFPSVPNCLNHKWLGKNIKCLINILRLLYVFLIRPIAVT